MKRSIWNMPWLGPLVVAITGAVMLVWSWGTWPDAELDFGRELYVPWQLSQGKVLYRDIVSYFNGPLSPYLHALLFKIFGVSLLTLVWFNLLVLALLITLLYRLIAQAAGHLAATACGVAFFVLFAFAEFVIAGNYNYVCPYSYELTHGITLTVAGIACLSRWSRTNHRGWLITSGVLLGLVFLTKAEIFFAAAMALSIGVIAQSWIRKIAMRRAAADTAIFIAAAIVPVVIAIALLMLNLSLEESISGVAGAWKWAGDKQLISMPYFTTMAGTDHVAQSLGSMLWWMGGYLGVFGLPLSIGLLLQKPGKTREAAVGIVFVIWLGAGLWWWPRIDWNQFIRPIPLVLGMSLIIVALRILRRKSQRVLPLVLLVWSMAMLSKMFLNAHIYHYGFALAMPATLVTIVLLIGWLPAWIDRVGGCGWVLRGAAISAIAITIWVHGHILSRYWLRKTIVVGSGGDQFYADRRGLVVNAAIQQLALVAPQKGTLLVVPEGLILNYLTRLENPTGQLNFTPPAIVMYGEDEMLRAIREHSPDFVVLTIMDAGEYGPRFFGEDYAKKMGAWLDQKYAVVRAIGPFPFRGTTFGMIVKGRK